jgi:hypothetical protein
MLYSRRVKQGLTICPGGGSSIRLFLSRQVGWLTVRWWFRQILPHQNRLGSLLLASWRSEGWCQ